MNAAAVLSLVAAVLLVYARTANYTYVMLDDYTYVVVTPELRDGLSTAGIRWAFETFRGLMWMPLTWISYMAEIEYFGIDPGVQHVTNLVLHAINAVLFYLLAARLLRLRFAAWIVAMLFAVHPVHVESVAWVAERKDVLFGLFYLAALLAFAAWYERRSLALRVGFVALSACAMMAKPMAVSLPVAMFLLCIWPLGRFRGLDTRDRGSLLAELGWLVRLLGPVALLAAGTVALTIVAARVEMVPAAQLSLVFRAGNALYSVAAYLWDLVLPVGLSPMYPLRTLLLFQEFLPALATIAVLAAAAWRWRRNRPWIAVALVWFVVSLLPVSGIFQMGPQARADRFVYMPAIGVYLAVGAELARASPAWLRRWRLPIAGILLMYGALAWIQVGYWANPYMFSTRILDVVGDNVDAHVGLVQVFLDAGDIESAERHAEAALASSPGHYQAFTVLGNVYLAKGEYAKAETMFRSALERRKDYLTPRMNLAIALRAQGREEEASAVVAEGITENRVLVPQAPRPPRQATGADPGS